MIPEVLVLVGGFHLGQVDGLVEEVTDGGALVKLEASEDVDAPGVLVFISELLGVMHSHAPYLAPANRGKEVIFVKLAEFIRGGADIAGARECKVFTWELLWQICFLVE